MPVLDRLFINIERKVRARSRSMAAALEDCLAVDMIRDDVDVEQQHSYEMVRIYVGNLSALVTKQYLTELFGLDRTEYLKRTCKVEMPVDEAGKCQHFAYVWMH